MGEIKQINIKSRAYYFYNDIVDEVKIQGCQKVTKNHLNALVFTTLDISQLKKLTIVKIFTV